MKKIEMPFFSVLSFVCGCLYSISFIPNTSGWFSFVAVGLVFSTIIWYGVLWVNLLRLSILVFCFSIGKWLVGMGWVFNSLTNYGNFPTFLAVIATLIAAVGMGFFLYITVLLYLQIVTQLNKYQAKQLNTKQVTHQTIFCSATLFALAWLLMEVVRDNFSFFNVAWLNLGYSMIDTQIFAPIISIIGVYGVSFWLAWSAATIIGIVLKLNSNTVKSSSHSTFSLYFDWAYFVIWLGVTVILLLYSQFKIPAQTVNTQVINPQAKHYSGEHTLLISVKHTNVNPISKWSPAGNKLLWSQLLDNNNLQADLLIWPEGIIAGALNLSSVTENDSTFILSNSLAALPAPVLFGSITNDGQHYYNSALLYANDKYQYYHKEKLVAFGEFTPNFLSPIANLLNIPFSSLQSSNLQPVPMHLTQDDKTWNIGVIICYESNFADYVRKIANQSDFLVVLTESQWFTPSYQPWQHLQMTRARAMENGQWVVFVNNGGPSAIIDPAGNIVEQSQAFVADTIDFSIPGTSIQTVYSSYGNAGLYFILLILLIVFIINNKVNRLSADK